MYDKQDDAPREKYFNDREITAGVRATIPHTNIFFLLKYTAPTMGRCDVYEIRLGVIPLLILPRSKETTAGVLKHQQKETQQ